MILKILFITTALASSSTKVELGKKLFFDKRLSGNNQMSCATCHRPEFGWTDGVPLAIGNQNKILLRKTPTVAYLDDDKVFFWDGRSSSLEQQAIIPLTSPDEMNQNIIELIGELESIPEYRDNFLELYPIEGISQHTIIDAIVSFEKSLNKRNSPFDKYINGDQLAISQSAKNGYSTFSTLKSNCLFCHKGSDFTDQKLWDVGVSGSDSGRNGEFLFKTASLRDVALRKNFFHNGSYKSLYEVIKFYSRGGDVHRPTQSPHQRPSIDLSEKEIYEVIEFLKSLTGETHLIATPKIP